jgi:hypothetical protein
MTTDEKLTEAEMKAFMSENDATWKALMDWCLEHNADPFTVLDAASFWLGLNAEDKRADLKLAREILNECFQAGYEAEHRRRVV